MRFLIILVLLFALSAKGELNKEPKVTTIEPIKSYTLMVELSGGPGAKLLEQQIDLEEGESFRVTTSGEMGNFTISGTLGKEDGKAIPLEIKTESYLTEKSNVTLSGTYSLKFSGKKEGYGTRHLAHMVSIRKNQRRVSPG